MKILVTLPTYNESENISKLSEEILRVAPELDILIIDDNSPDGTGQIADELAQKYSNKIFAIHRQGKLGLGSAIMAGFKYAIDKDYEFVINMDCDFSHDPCELPQIISALPNADLVVSSRHVAGGKIIGWNKKRLALHWCAQQYTNLLLGTYVHDHTNSYKAYRVSMLKQLPLEEMLKKGTGYVWHTLLIHEIFRKGFKIAEVPSVFVDRRAGKSKMSTKEMLGGLWAIFKMRVGSDR